MAESKKEEIEICEVPRWQRIKATLNNLDYNAFVEGAKNDPNAFLLDVRTPAEHDGISIPGSTNINYLSQNLADEIEVLDPSLTYYVYCRTGRRSLRVCVIMRNLGFERVYNLDGGIVSQ